MEDILKITIFTLVGLECLILIWFIVLLNLSLNKIQEEYSTLSLEEKKDLLDKGLSKMQVFKAFIFKKSLKNYIWYFNSLKDVAQEKKLNVEVKQNDA